MNKQIKKILTSIIIIYIGIFIFINDTLAAATFYGNGDVGGSGGSGTGGSSNGFTGISQILLFSLVDTSQKTLDRKQTYYMIVKKGGKDKYVYEENFEKENKSNYTICGLVNEKYEDFDACYNWKDHQFPEGVHFDQSVLKGSLSQDKKYYHSGILSQFNKDGKNIYINFNVDKLREAIIGEDGVETEQYVNVVKYFLSKELGINYDDYKDNAKYDLNYFNELLYKKGKQIHDYKVIIEPVYANKKGDKYYFYTSKGLALNNIAGKVMDQIYENLNFSNPVDGVINVNRETGQPLEAKPSKEALKDRFNGAGYAVVNLSYTIEEVKHCKIEKQGNKYILYLNNADYRGELDVDNKGVNLELYVKACGCGNTDLKNNLNGILATLNELGNEKYDIQCGNKECKVSKLNNNYYFYTKEGNKLEYDTYNNVENNFKKWIDSCGCDAYNKLDPSKKTDLKTKYTEDFDKIHKMKCDPPKCEITLDSNGIYTFYDNYSVGYENDSKGDNFRNYLVGPNINCGCDKFNEQYDKFKNSLLQQKTIDGLTYEQIYNINCKSCSVNLDTPNKTVTYHTGDGGYYQINYGDGIQDGDVTNFRNYIQSCGCDNFNNNYDKLGYLLSLPTPDGKTLQSYYASECNPRCEINYDSSTNTYSFYDSDRNYIAADETSFSDLIDKCTCSVVDKKPNILNNNTYKNIYNKKCINACSITFNANTNKLEFYDNSNNYIDANPTEFEKLLKEETCGCDIVKTYPEILYEKEYNEIYNKICKKCTLENIDGKYNYYDKNGDYFAIDSKENFEHFIDEGNGGCGCDIFDNLDTILKSEILDIIVKKDETESVPKTRLEEIYNNSSCGAPVIRKCDYVEISGNYTFYLNNGSTTNKYKDFISSCGCSHNKVIDLKPKFSSEYDNKCPSKGFFNCDNDDGSTNGKINMTYTEKINDIFELKCEEELIMTGFKKTTNEKVGAGKYLKMNNPQIKATKICKPQVSEFDDLLNKYVVYVQKMLNYYSDYAAYDGGIKGTAGKKALDAVDKWDCYRTWEYDDLSFKSYLYEKLYFRKAEDTEGIKIGCGSNTDEWRLSEDEVDELAEERASIAFYNFLYYYKSVLEILETIENIQMKLNNFYSLEHEDIKLKFGYKYKIMKSGSIEDKIVEEVLENINDSDNKYCNGTEVADFKDEACNINIKIDELPTINFHSSGDVDDFMSLSEINNFFNDLDILENDDYKGDTNTKTKYKFKYYDTPNYTYSGSEYENIEDYFKDYYTSIGFGDKYSVKVSSLKFDIEEVEFKEVKEFEFNAKKKYVQPLTGKVVNSFINGYSELGEVYPIDLSAQIKDDNENKYTLSIDPNSDTAKRMQKAGLPRDMERKCTYKITNDIIECKNGACDAGRESKLLVKYKTIDPSNMDPNDRINSDGFKNYRSNEAIAVMDKLEKDAKEGNTFHPDKIEYSFTLEPRTIKLIKEYNASTKYIDSDSLNLECNDINKCKSVFISDAYSGTGIFNDNAFGNLNKSGSIYGRSTWKDIIIDKPAKKYKIDGEEFISDYEFIYE